MISIVTAYYNRKRLFLRTLQSLARYGKGRDDFEVVAVDDGSREEERIEDLAGEFPFLRVIRLEVAQKWYSNPCMPFNLAIREARGEALILQNPECLHVGDVLADVRARLAEGVYLSYGCYALSAEATTDLQHLAPEEVQSWTEAQTLLDVPPAVVAGEGWYNHSVINPRAFHFCGALTRSDVERLGGFDERYAKGIAYDDDELVHRIRAAGIRVQFVDNPRVFHQNHYGSPGSGIPCPLNLRNEKVFRLLTRPSPAWRANPAGWGDPSSLTAEKMNEALDELILGKDNLYETLAVNERVAVEALERAQRESECRQKRETAQQVRLLQESALHVEALVRRVRLSWAGRLGGWRLRHERRWQSLEIRMKKAHALAEKGKMERAVPEYVRALAGLAILADEAAHAWWHPWRERRRWARAQLAQAKALCALCEPPASL